MSGTSMAAPYVSGLAAILRGLPGNDSVDTIIQQIENSALALVTPGPANYYGYGLIQVANAIQLALATPTTVDVPTSLPAITVPDSPVPAPTEAIRKLPQSVSSTQAYDLSAHGFQPSKTPSPILIETISSTPTPTMIISTPGQTMTPGTGPFMKLNKPVQNDHQRTNGYLILLVLPVFLAAGWLVRVVTRVNQSPRR
jgi:hypothetical protein